MKIIAPFLTCAVRSGFEGEPDELAEALAQGYSLVYITTPKGIFLHQVLSSGKDGAPRFVRMEVKEIVGAKMQEVKPFISFLPDGKIPVDFFHTILAFFRNVMVAKKGKNEAMIWIMWSQARGYFLHVPNQVVGPASARYDWNDIPSDSSIIVDIHSHQDMDAFYSGTDNGDDNGSVRFSGVFGKISSSNPMTVWRFNWRDKKLEVKMEDLFVAPEPEVAAPDPAWIEKVKTFGEMATTYKLQYGSGQGVGRGGVPGYIGYDGRIGGYAGGRNFPHYQGDMFTGEEDDNPLGGTYTPPSRHPFHPGSEAPQPGALNHVGGSNWKASSTSERNVPPSKTQSGTQSSETSSTPYPARSYALANGNTTKFPSASVTSPKVVTAVNGKHYLDNGQFFTEIPIGDLPHWQAYTEARERDSAREARKDAEVLEKTSEGVQLNPANYNGHAPDSREAALERLQIRIREMEAARLEATDGGTADEEDTTLIGVSDAGEVNPEEADPTGISYDRLGAWCFVNKEDYPPNFDEYAVECGPDVAAAFAIIQEASTVLVDSGEPARQAAEEIFAAVKDEEKLSVLRTLYQFLPDDAQLSLAETGF